MIGGYIYNPPRPAIIQQVSYFARPQSSKFLIAKGCNEVRRWYAWTRCGNVTCCKLYIACSNGTIVTQTVEGASCG